MKAFLTIMALGLIALMPAAFAMEGHDAAMEDKMMKKDVHLVVFYSDTCGSCKIMEPKMMEAMNVINKESFNMVKFDFSNAETIEATRSLAAENNVDSTLQKYGAKTGFAVLVDSEGNELAKITKDDDAATIANKITNSILSGNEAA